MGKYSKLIGAIIGSVLGLFLAWVASLGLGTCDADGMNCVVLGMDQATITAGVMTLLTYFGVWVAPPNG